MDFRILALPVAPFREFFGRSDEELAARGVLRRRVDRYPGFPCRVGLRDAPLGSHVLLLNFEHLPVASPYRSRHAIYVEEGAVQAHPAINEIPDVLRCRLLSLRAFDAAGMLLDADVMPGSELAPAIRCMLGNAHAGFLHVHNAKHGCYAARVERAAR